MPGKKTTNAIKDFFKLCIYAAIKDCSEIFKIPIYNPNEYHTYDTLMTPPKKRKAGLSHVITINEDSTELLNFIINQCTYGMAENAPEIPAFYYNAIMNFTDELAFNDTLESHTDNDMIYARLKCAPGATDESAEQCAAGLIRLYKRIAELIAFQLCKSKKSVTADIMIPHLAALLMLPADYLPDLYSQVGVLVKTIKKAKSRKKKAAEKQKVEDEAAEEEAEVEELDDEADLEDFNE